MNECGIYGIVNCANNKILIGSSKHIKTRWQEHRYYLRRGKHCNRHLQGAWNIYGESSFEFRIIELCNITMLVARENYWMDYHKSIDTEWGYNLQNATQSFISDATRKKMSITRKGVKFTDEHKRKIGESQRSRKMSEEQKEHLRKLNTGKKQSESTKRKISDAIRGIKRSQETLRRMSESAKRYAESKRTENNCT